MGGRGSSSGLGGGTGTAEQNFSIPKVTGKQLAQLSREQLRTISIAISANNMMSKGLSKEEAFRRATLLDGDTDAQLRKYILKYGRKYWE